MLAGARGTVRAGLLRESELRNCDQIERSPGPALFPRYVGQRSLSGPIKKSHSAREFQLWLWYFPSPR